MKKITILFVLVLFAWTSAFAQAKYIFYFIGDGMGANQVLTTEMYLAELNHRIGRNQLCMTTFPFSGQLATFSDSNGITDSSAAGTCLATGHKTTNGTLGVDPEGKNIDNVAERLKKQGFGIGIMTSVSIDHATPGAFYAHSQSRNNYYEIGAQLAESGMDFFGGSSFLSPTDKDNPDNPNLYTYCQDHGYIFVHGEEECKHHISKEKLILIPQSEGQDIQKEGPAKIGYAIDAQKGDLRLPDITRLAIQHLSMHHDRFFMMVEGGSIDWACHGNDAASAIHDVLEFDEAIREAYNFYLAHPDETLIIVTADHETGGMALGNSDYTLNLQILQNQKVSADKLTDGLKTLMAQQGKKLKWTTVQAYLSQQLGFYNQVTITKEEDMALQEQFKLLQKHNSKGLKTLYKEIDGLSKAALDLLNKKAKIGWTTNAHSASAVPVFAIGAGAEFFTGWHDNSEVVPYILKSAGY